MRKDLCFCPMIFTIFHFLHRYLKPKFHPFNLIEATNGAKSRSWFQLNMFLSDLLFYMISFSKWYKLVYTIFCTIFHKKLFMLWPLGWLDNNWVRSDCKIRVGKMRPFSPNLNLRGLFRSIMRTIIFEIKYIALTAIKLLREKNYILLSYNVYPSEQQKWLK